ncbi:MAG: helix-turn-helix domain-containing protein [Thermoleophilaceae bacterium]
MSATAELVGGKWTLLVIRDLGDGPQRFCELERSLAGISPRTLSLRLRALEDEGILVRGTRAGRRAARRVRADREGPRPAAARGGHAPLRA